MTDLGIELPMTSDQVQDRYLIQVQLPDDYFESPNSQYPVIYLTDGDRYFGLASDLVHAELQQNGVGAILVGIGYGSRELNDQKRDRDLRSQDGLEDRSGAERFRDFLRLELLPTIESEYRIDPQRRTLAGWSRGGTFALHTLFASPEMFRNYVSLSPRLDYEDWSVVRAEQEYAKGKRSLPSALFLSIGAEDERQTVFPAFVNKLRSRDYEDFELMSETIDGYDHELTALFLGLRSALVSLFHRPNIADLMQQWINSDGVDSAVAQYRSIRAKSPDQYDFRERRLNELGYHYLQAGRMDLSVEILELNVEAYPNSFNVYDSLGEALVAAGDLDAARVNYLRSVELNPENENGKSMIQRIDQMVSAPRN